MAFGSLNPFTGIIETKFSPHARTLRTGFGRKVLDTFSVFWGHPTDLDRPKWGKARMGLFDYATLMVPYIIHRINHWANKRAHLGGTYEEQSRRHPAVIPVLFLTAPLAGILLVARFIFSITATVAALPIIGAVQLVASLASRKLKKDVDALVLTDSFEDQLSQPSNQPQSSETIKAYLERLSSGVTANISNISLVTGVVDSDSVTKGVDLEIVVSRRRRIADTNYYFDRGDYKRVSAHVDFNNQSQKAALRAMWRLNLWNCAGRLEGKGQDLTEFSKTYLSPTPSK